MANNVVTLGEIMLWLKFPCFGLFFQSPVLEATFGGGSNTFAAGLLLQPAHRPVRQGRLGICCGGLLSEPFDCG
jgi:hypothetical protein